jgi:hypothetical protein
VTILVLAAVGLAALVLPGYGIRTILRRPHADAIDELELAVGTTLIATTVVGVALIGFEAFSASRMAVPFVILGLIGIPRAARWIWPRFRRPALYVLLALTTPWVWNALRDGFPPAGLFQWYYWDLGRALSDTHGIPSYVTEFGVQVRWLPDYLIFNILAETYRGAARFGSAAEQLSAFRIPLALLGIVAVFGVLRLWLRPWTALTGTALVVATLAFADKFNTFKPESYGIILGLIAVRLGVRGVRRKDPMLLLFAGVIVGLNLGVHAIGAVIAGMLLAGAVVAELVTVAEARRRSTIGALLLAGMLAIGVAGAAGWALQGRTLVISDASNPARLADGRDPTFLFLERNAGHFGEVEAPSLDEELSDNLQMPWDGFDLTSLWGALLGAGIVAGIGIGLRARRRSLQQAVIAIVTFAVLLTAGVVYFAASYDTFVPRHTGLGRFVQYAPLVIAMLAAVAIEGVAVRLDSVSEESRQRFARVMTASAVVVGAVAIGISLTLDRYETQNELPRSGERVLETLAEQGRPGEVVLVNVGTRGVFEFWTDLEDPLEARQALIENPKFVARATARLEDTNRFFTGTGAADLPDRLGVDWIVVAPLPSELGAGASYGTPPAGWTVPGFVAQPARDGFIILRRDPPTPQSGEPRAAFIGPAQDRRTETLLVLLVVGGIVAAVWVAWRAAGRRSRPPRGQVPEDSASSTR